MDQKHVKQALFVAQNNPQRFVDIWKKSEGSIGIGAN
jgi:hypothetical protein